MCWRLRLSLQPCLRQARSGIEGTALVNEGTEAMVQNSPHVDSVLVLMCCHPGRLVARRFQLGLLRNLRAQHCFDLALELSGGDRGLSIFWPTAAASPTTRWRSSCVKKDFGASSRLTLG